MVELPEEGDASQVEADLLADGRGYLEGLADSLRFRYLYPAGADLSLLFAAYQDLWRERRSGLLRGSQRRILRRPRRLLRQHFRRDTMARELRLVHGYPEAAPRRRDSPLPPLLLRALAEVDADVREELRAYITGETPELQPSASASGVGPAPARLARGLDQLRQAVINRALANPAAIPNLSYEDLRLCRSPRPKVRRHPLKTLILVKAPIYLWISLLLIFNTAYFAAWWLFNDETLGGFLGPAISTFIDGDLEFESVHWRPRLILDLLTGTPSPVTVRGFRIYEGHTYFDLPQRRLTASAEVLEARIVLHEIIPWNRLGVPPILEIPWVLHLTEAHAIGPVGLRVHQYALENRRGVTEWRLSLIGAFKPPNDEPAPLHTRGISFRIDDFQSDDLSLDVDFRTSGQWQTTLHLDRIALSLDYLGVHPLEPPKLRLPLSFELREVHGDGQLDILSLGDDGYRIPLRDLELRRIWAGRDAVPFGDLQLTGSGSFSGSPAVIDAVLGDFMGDDPQTDLSLAFDDLGPLAALVIAAHALPASTVDASGSPGLLTIRGPISDPTLTLAATQISLSPDEAHPEWILDNTDLSVALRRQAIPEIWAPRFAPGSERWIAELDRFDALFLGGGINLHRRAITTRILLPEGDDPGFLIAADLELTDVDPSILITDDPTTSALFAGTLRGHLAIPSLALDLAESMTVSHVEADLEGVELQRRGGPTSDGLPKTVRIDGGLGYDVDDGIDLRTVAIAVPGGRVEIDGGTDGALANLRPTDVSLRISDGDAFLRGFAVDPYFDRLEARMTLSGPLGAPNGSGGSLTLQGAGTGDVVITGIDQARLGMDRGRLHLRSPRIAVLGGEGPLDAELHLFSKGALTSDPKLRLSTDLSGLDLGRASGGLVRGVGDLDLDVGAPGGQAIALSAFTARGALYARELAIGDANLRDAEVAFDLDPQRLRVGSLRVAYHRRVSPSISPTVTIPTGELSGSGTIGFDRETTLALDLAAKDLPLSLLAAVVEYPEPPFGGKIAAGSKIHLGGTLSQPAVDGEIRLQALSAAGIPLGHGNLGIHSADVAAGDGLAARREIRLKGAFRQRGQANPADRLDWRVAGHLALGAKTRRSDAPFAAEISATFAHFPLSNLLHGSESALRETLAGQLEGATIRARLCDRQGSLLATCTSDQVTDDLVDIHVDLELDRLWVHERGAAIDDPCGDRTALCSANRLVATLDGSELRLREPWTLRSGGDDDHRVTLAGTFELSEPPTGEVVDDQCQASSQRPSLRTREVRGGNATLRGDLALSALLPLLKPSGIQELDGEIAVDLGIRGHVSDPVIEGSIDIPTTEVPLALGLALRETPLKVHVPTLLVRIDGDHIYPSGTVAIQGQRIDFGDFRRDGREATYYTLAGPCAGNFAVAAQGVVGGALLQELLPDVLTRASGSVVVDSVFLAGRSADDLEIDALRLSASPGPNALRGTLNLAEIEPFVLDQGIAEFARCTATDPCPGGVEGYAAFLGGRRGAAANAASSAALRIRLGDRGRMITWGHVIVSSDFQRIVDARLQATIDELSYRQFDNSGRPELLATVSSEGLLLEGRESLILRGELRVDRSRWIRDAQQGVKVLSFADPSTAPESPPPELLRDLLFDLRVSTISPFRVDNNVLKGVEGQVALNVGGSFADPDLQGRIDVNTGILDLTILGSAFDIQYGRVTLEHDLEESRVDLLASRQEPIYIEGSPRQMAVRLSGTLDAINMECIVQGDTRTRQRTTRECVDYLILGAGTREVADTSGVRRTGGGGLLGKPIGLVGSLTELKLDRYVEESAPRIAPYVPDVSMRLGQYGVEIDAETPRPWFRSEWGNLSVGAGYTRGYPGLLLRNSSNWRVRFQILDNATLEFRDSQRSYFNERIIFDPLRQRSLELRLDHQIPSLR